MTAPEALFQEQDTSWTVSRVGEKLVVPEGQGPGLATMISPLLLA